MAASDIRKAATLSALHANSGDLDRTVKETGVPKTTLVRWSKGIGIQPEIAPVIDQAKEELADACERIAREAIGAITTTKLQEAPVNHLSTVSGTFIDKMLVLRGQPNVIVENQSEAERAQRVKELLERNAAKAGVVFETTKKMTG